MAAVRDNKRRKLALAARRRAPPEDQNENIINRLPPQIMGDILLRLSSSIKTIIYCRCVCKSWYEILSDSFITQSLIATSPPNVLLLFPGYSVTNCLIKVQKEEFSLKKKKVSRLLHLNKLFIPGTYKLIGSCNGLLCFKTGSDNQSCYYIFNPVLGRNRTDFVMLPQPNIDPSHTKKRPDLKIKGGLGFCPKTNQYKVVRSMNPFGDYVYTIGTDSWRRIENSPANYSISVTGLGVYLNGALHWLSSGRKIWCFDLYTEKFHQFLLLPILQQSENYKKFDFGLHVFDNCLAVYFKEERNSNKLKIWVMKDYGVEESWANIFSVSENYEEQWVWNSIPLKLTKDGSLLIVYDNGKSSLVYFDLRNGEVVEKRMIYGLKKRSKAYYCGVCIAHIPTLISPKHIMKSSSPPTLNIVK